MLDIKFIRENLELVKNNIVKRNVKADAALVVELYNRKNEIQVKLDGLRSIRNENAQKMKSKLPENERNILIDEGKSLKIEIASLEEDQKKIEAEYFQEAMKIPNLTHPGTPIGATDKDSLELRKVGEIRKFNYKPKDHIQLGTELDILDFESGATVSGQKFYYLKKGGALLEMALIQYAIKKLCEKGFIPYITPDVAKEDILKGIGFNPRGDETNIYSIEGTDLCLIATAEITIGGMFLNKTLSESELPVKIAGYSHCFRTEAGAAGARHQGPLPRPSIQQG